jgi:multicomponent Na+:H+ antiporter subunit D
MIWEALIPVLALASSLVPGVIIFLLSEQQYRIRTILNLAGAVIKLILVAVMLGGAYFGREYETRLPMLPGLDFLFRADALAMLFITLSAFLWLLTTVYAVAYLEGSPHRGRFFGYFSLCVTTTIGIALAGNLFTFVVFYEALTLATYPLVVHRGTPESLRAGRVYLAYTLGGGAVLLLGAVWLHAIVGPIYFGETGSVASLENGHRGELIAIFLLLIAGLGVKASLVPLHGWLPIAMVAPAPVSALLHAVAVVKAGAFGIVRVVYDVYGIDFAYALGVTPILAGIAALTIVYGSICALFQDGLKRRLAFSTISQVSYITLGVAVMGPSSTVGGVVHLVHQGLMKITLFFCAGNLSETLHIHNIRQMNGIGWRMPWTMTAFTLAAFGMIGLPPMAGFISKWYLGMGGLEAGQPWVLAVLAISTILNAAYFLPLVYTAWFKPSGDSLPPGRQEAGWALLAPPLVTAILSLLVGLFAAVPFSPLQWTRLIVTREYQP